MVVLGIDPGYAIVGCGTVNYERGKLSLIDMRAITTPPKMPFEKRLESIYNDICALIEKTKPDAMAVEELFFSKNITTGIAVAEARGVILLTARQAGVPIFEYTPMQVKQAVVGYGLAEKKQVIAMVTSLLGLPKPPKPDDTADALAIAMCHGQNNSSRIAKYYNQR